MHLTHIVSQIMTQLSESKRPPLPPNYIAFFSLVVDVHLVELPDQCTRCTEASAHLSAEGSISFEGFVLVKA
jgi:hypothetical protein